MAFLSLQKKIIFTLRYLLVKLRWMCMYGIRSTIYQVQTYFHNTFNVSKIKKMFSHFNPHVKFDLQMNQHFRGNFLSFPCISQPLDWTQFQMKVTCLPCKT